jgi:hypothetical protein
MSRSKKFAYSLVKSRRSFFGSYLIISAAWYVSLFPGRLGFDYSKAIVMIQNGESTSWWTSLFWWFLRLSSLEGRTIAIASFLCLIGLGYSLFYLCESLPGKKTVNRLALLLVSLTPLYGAFGVNVSHDVFQVAGILIFTGFQFKVFSAREKISSADYLAVTLASAMVLTTHYGLPLIAVNVLLFLFQKYFKLAFLVSTTTALISVVSPIGITQVPTYGLVIPIIGDLKCIAQLETAELSDADWSFLLSIAPKAEWMNPKTCSFIDYSLEDMTSVKLGDIEFNKNLLSNYLRIGAKNPAVVAMAHFQRASVALPPPFFFGPPNQVIRDPDIPIGQGTNNALQSYPGVLHPSIDEPSVDLKIGWLAPLEALAQAGIFLINQASWFWGWGGLWLWPIVIYLAVSYKGTGIFIRLSILSNILVLHGLLLILAAPLPRYVISTILLGLLITVRSAICGYLRISDNSSQSNLSGRNADQP